MRFKDFVARKLFIEMGQDHIDHIEQWFEENPDELPFKHLFKDGEYRKIIPFESKQKLAFRKKLKDMGYEVDFESGMASKEVKTQRGSTVRQQKIGKVLSKSKDFDKETLDWWSTFAKQTDEKDDEYSIIVSRHPIDVLRMSDHSGITSCHAQGNDYFQCAVAEAKGGGGIAYLVNTKEAEDIEDLQGNEVFEDMDRHHGRERIGMVQPLSRVRLRLFKHKKDDYDLAVPETSSYGDRVEGFESSVSHWALSAQQNVLKGKRPSMKEFARYGGSYQDSSDSRLFNNMFNDEEDAGGNTNFEGEDDYQGQLDQYEEEAQSFHDQYANFDNEEVQAWFDVTEDDGAIVSFSGMVKVKFPLANWIKKPPEGWHDTYEGRVGSYSHRRLAQSSNKDDKNKGTWEEAINQMYGANDGPSDRNLEVSYKGDNIELSFEIRSEEGYYPDDYHSFLVNIMQEYDDNYQGFVVNCKKVLLELGWLSETKIDKWATGGKLFKNFKWNWDEDKHTLDVYSPRQMVGDLKDINHDTSRHPERPGDLDGTNAWRTQGRMNTVGGGNPGFKEFYTVFTQEILKYADRVQQASNRQLSLPGMSMMRNKTAPLSTVMSSTPIPPQISWEIDYDRNVYMKLSWDDLAMGAAAGEKTVAFIRWLDENWTWVANAAAKIFNMTVKRKYSAYAKAQQQPQGQVGAQNNPAQRPFH